MGYKRGYKIGAGTKSALYCTGAVIKLKPDASDAEKGFFSSDAVPLGRISYSNAKLEPFIGRKGNKAAKC